MTTELQKVTASSAAQITAHFDLSEEGAACVQPGQAPGELLDALVTAGCHADAVALLAHGLGRREAVWWACVCVRATLPADAPADVVAALAAAEAWCYEPTDERRWAAHHAADAQGGDHAAACAARGAYLGGDNLAPPESGATVAPGPFMTAKLVTGAVMMAALSREPQRAPERYEDFIARGVDIANGGWGNEPAGGA